MNLDKYVPSCNQHLNYVKRCPKSCQQSFLYICKPAVLPMNRQNLFLLPLNLGWTCDLTWPIECSRNEALLVLDLACKGGCFCICHVVRRQSRQLVTPGHITESHRTAKHRTTLHKGKNWINVLRHWMLIQPRIYRTFHHHRAFPHDLFQLIPTDPHS